jgi:hypothetical protein
LSVEEAALCGGARLGNSGGNDNVEGGLCQGRRHAAAACRHAAYSRTPRVLIAACLARALIGIYDSYTFHILRATMGIVNIDDDLHDQIRKASAVSCRSINAQAAFWIKVGMLCEMNPTQSFNEIVAQEMRAAGVVARADKRLLT